jgi:hypothetical protein
MAIRQDHVQLRPRDLLREILFASNAHDLRIDAAAAKLLLHQLRVLVVIFEVKDLQR